MSGSIYRLFGIYYTDLLDYIRNKEVKYQTLDAYYTHMSGEHGSNERMELMMKVGTLYWYMDALKRNASDYWKRIAKTSKGLFAMLVIFMIIILIGGFMLIYYSHKDMKRLSLIKSESFPKREFITLVLVILIIMAILYLVLILFAKNFYTRAIVAKNTERDLRTDYAMFTGRILRVNDDIVKALLLMVNRLRNNHSAAKKLYDEILKIKTSDSVIPARANELFSLQKTKGVSVITISYDPLFRTIINNLKGSLNSFYSGGRLDGHSNKGAEGYKNMKKILISANPIFMLKEMKSSLLYYYYLVEKSKSEEGEENDKNKGIIDSVVIKNLRNLSLLKQVHNGNGIKTDEKNAIKMLTLGDANINAAYELLLKRLNYLALFLYPLYVRKMPEAPDFPVNNFLANMPQRNLPEDSRYKDIFITVYNTKYSNVFNDLKNDTSSAAFFNKIDILIQKDFESYLSECFVQFAYMIKGDYMFCYDNEDLVVLLRTRFTSIEPFSLITDLDYGTYITRFFSDVLLDRMWKVFQDDLRTGALVDQRKNKFVSDVSTELMKTDIKSVSVYKNYIFEKLQTSDIPIDISSLSSYSQLFQNIDKQLVIKRSTTSDPFSVTPSGNRFISKEEFINKINLISFRDLIDELDATYLYDIVDEFYNNISKNIDAKTTKDIYFERQNKNESIKIIVVIVSIIVSLGSTVYIYQMIDDHSIYKTEFNKLLKNSDTGGEKMRMDSKEYLMQKTEYNNKLWFSTIMPIAIILVALLFFISLISSFYKKAKEKFEFNRSTIETNTAEFKKSLSELREFLINIENTQIATSGGGLNNKLNTAIGKLSNEISEDDKELIYKKIISIIDRYEKCNYINSVGNVGLQFPYAEASMDCFMIILAIIALAYVTGKLTPVDRIQKIKDLNIMKDKAEFGDESGINTELAELFGCHLEDMENLMFAIKLIMFIFVVMFLIFYSFLILESTGKFRQGLYNSKYFEESKCYDL